MDTELKFAATCPKGVEQILAAELKALGAYDAKESRAAVLFTGDLKLGLRACLWSRVASRVLVELAEFPAATAEELYEGVAAIPWEEHLSPTSTLAVDANGQTAGLTHSGFSARKVKDAVVDRLRDKTGTRPSVDLESPDLRLNLRLRRERGTLSIDLAGAPLHRRGYRTPGEQAEAPLKENLAAALLIRAGWPDIARDGGSLLDPMCGSGTLLIEGALMATDRAPGLMRDRWGFSGWLKHDSSIWDALIDDADDRAEVGDANLPRIIGWDIDPNVLELARACIKAAGFGERIATERHSLYELEPTEGAKPGLVITNPPYGVRLGSVDTLVNLYAQLGKSLLEGFDGWRAAVFTAEDDLARATGLRSEKAYKLYNGAVETKLFIFDVSPAIARREVVRAAEPASGATDSASDSAAGTASAGSDETPTGSSAGAEMFANRLRKNSKHIGKWARRQNITCYRLYDADLPEYAVAIDVYAGEGPDEGRRVAHVQEYAPPAIIDPEKARQRLEEAVVVVPQVLEIDPADIAFKVRERKRGSQQYEKLDRRGEVVQVGEGGLRFEINLHDYLDTGLFLDHRPTRARVRELADGTRFLNLFAYTGSASCFAASGGAAQTTTVDMSATYLDWARRNMKLNGFHEGPEHHFVQADALAWIAEEAARIVDGEAEPYDLIFLDPPSFSNSKRMGDRTFDVQRDHAELVRSTMGLLAEDGTLVFSNNLRRFKLEESALADLDITDISRETLPKDYERNPKIHRCYMIRALS